MFKKAQAAMEFLMTYGWAILVVLVVIGALSYFGVLSPATLLPEKCTFPVSISCVDHSVSDGTITLVLQNGAGRDMWIRDMGALSDALADGSQSEFCRLDSTQRDYVLRNGQRATFNMINSVAGTECDYNEVGRDKNRYNINITYSWADSQVIRHRIDGELLAKSP